MYYVYLYSVPNPMHLLYILSTQKMSPDGLHLSCQILVIEGYFNVNLVHFTFLNCEFIFKTFLGFPGGAVVGSLPAGAGDAGSGPGLGGSRMPRSSWACEPRLLGLCVWSPCSAIGEAAMVGGPHTAMGGGPRLPQLERALARKRGPNTANK